MFFAGATHNFADTFFHFARGFVGEGKGEDIESIHTFVYEVRDAIG